METSMIVEPSSILPAGWEVSGTLPIVVTQTAPPFSQVLLETATQLPFFFLLVVGLWLIQRIAASIKQGDPFSHANARRLARIGVLLLAGYPLAVLAEGLFRNWFFSNENSPVLPEAEITIGFPLFSLSAILGGVCFLVLAEVFRYGLRLREDVEATV
jgi:hypothetical protein